MRTGGAADVRRDGEFIAGEVEGFIIRALLRSGNEQFIGLTYICDMRLL